MPTAPGLFSHVCTLRASSEEVETGGIIKATNYLVTAKLTALDVPLELGHRHTIGTPPVRSECLRVDKGPVGEYEQAGRQTERTLKTIVVPSGRRKKFSICILQPNSELKFDSIPFTRSRLWCSFLIVALGSFALPPTA
jgi:hypothetical protein